MLQYSLGCVLYELTTGTRPFAGPTAMSVLTSIAVDQPTAPNLVKTDISAELSQLIMRLLEKDPAKRPESAQAVAAILGEIPTKTSPPQTPGTQGTPEHRGAAQSTETIVVADDASGAPAPHPTNHWPIWSSACSCRNSSERYRRARPPPAAAGSSR